jgi:hypothetical protein
LIGVGTAQSTAHSGGITKAFLSGDVTNGQNLTHVRAGQRQRICVLRVDHGGLFAGTAVERERERPIPPSTALSITVLRSHLPARFR